jgi:hypothetical protein
MLYEQLHNASWTTAQCCTNNCTMLYEQLHNAVQTTAQCFMNNCTMLYEQLHNALWTTTQCCMNNRTMLYEQLHNVAHRFVVSLPTTSYTQPSFTPGWHLVTFPKSTEITCIDQLLLQHALTEQRINTYHVTHILQFRLNPTFTSMVLFVPV